MDQLAEIGLMGLDPKAKDCDGYTPNDCFYRYRDYICTVVREPFEVEEKAWKTLMGSVCRQNGIDPRSLDYYCHVSSEVNGDRVDESGDSDEEYFTDAAEGLDN